MGFTIIELMFVVAIVGILTTVALVSYSKSTRKAKSSEVRVLFAEFQTREEAYATENGRYLGVCNVAMPVAPPDVGCVEGNYWPSPLDTQHKMNVTAPPARWSALRISPGKADLYCQYAVIAGPGNFNGNMGPIGAEIYADVGGMPRKNWFYMMAQCDWDNDSSVNAMYWQRGDLSLVGSNGNEAR